MDVIQFILLGEVLELFRFGKTKLYGDIQKGIFPPPVKIGTSSRWLVSEVQEVIRAYAKGATEADLVLLVHDLVERRKA